MKRIALLVAVLLLPALAQSKILVGRVDIQKVLVSIEAGKRLKNRLEKDFKKKQAQIKKEEGEIRKLQQKIEKQRAVLSKQALEKKARELNGKIAKLQEKSRSFSMEMQRKEAEGKGPILKNLEGIIAKVSKDAGVDLSFEASGAAVVYAKDKIDLTPKVIEAYNKKFK
jgi:outer membrane protein